MRRIHTARALVAMMALLILVLAACGGGGGGAIPTCTPSGTQLHIAVEEGTSHRFNTECLAAPANQAFTIQFDNHDSSLMGNHNIHIFDGADFVGDVVFHGKSITYEVGALEAGTFKFKCDIHTFMNGTFIVK